MLVKPRCLVSTLSRAKNVDDDDLIQAIKEIAMTDSSTDPRCRTEVINSCKDLDDLTKELSNSGFDLSHSLVYLRFVLRRKDSTECKQDKKSSKCQIMQRPVHATINESRSMVCGSHYQTC